MQPNAQNENMLNAHDLTIAVVTSSYHAAITEALRDGASETFLGAGGSPDRLLHIEAPGTYELPVLCSHCCVDHGQGTPDAIVALGCVIRGETSHDQHINMAVSNQLARLSVDTGIPIAFGVLTCETMEQAHARAGGDQGHKGIEAMTAALQTISAIQTLHQKANGPA
jgi:6,7-dimethyl-8-ribityllumazine synthase